MMRSQCAAQRFEPCTFDLMDERHLKIHACDSMWTWSHHYDVFWVWVGWDSACAGLDRKENRSPQCLGMTLITTGIESTEEVSN